MQALEKIPNQLKSLTGDWLNWHYEKKDGKEKTIKVPEVPANWYDKPQLTFEEAVARSAANPQKGIGIAFRTYNNIVGIDIDNMPDNAIPPKIKAILSSAKNGGYIERSVSQTGFHIIGPCSFKPILLKLFQNYKGKDTATGLRTEELELYAINRFFTVSGFVLYNNWNNIDLSISLAWEYITGKNILDSIAALYGGTQTETKRSGESAPIQSVCGENTTQTSVATIPRPENAMTDEEIAKLPLRPLSFTIEKMYKSKPILKRILQKDGYTAAEEYWNLYKTNNEKKDKTPSGFDQEIASVITFWLYRYGPDTITKILKNSVLDRKKKADDYWNRTAHGAYERAIEYFAATHNLPELQKSRLEAWMSWKKEIAKHKENKDIA